MSNLKNAGRENGEHFQKDRSWERSREGERGVDDSLATGSDDTAEELILGKSWVHRPYQIHGKENRVVGENRAKKCMVGNNRERAFLTHQVEELSVTNSQEAVSHERASIETLSLSISLSGSGEGEFEPFDTMNASTLATRSNCNSLDVSHIGAVPG